MEPYKTLWTPIKPHEVLRNPLEPYGTLWNPTKTLWNPTKTLPFHIWAVMAVYPKPVYKRLNNNLSVLLTIMTYVTATMSDD